MHQRHQEVNECSVSRSVQKKDVVLLANVKIKRPGRAKTRRKHYHHDELVEPAQPGGAEPGFLPSWIDLLHVLSHHCR